MVISFMMHAMQSGAEECYIREGMCTDTECFVAFYNHFYDNDIKANKYTHSYVYHNNIL